MQKIFHFVVLIFEVPISTFISVNSYLHHPYKHLNFTRMRARLIFFLFLFFKIFISIHFISTIIHIELCSHLCANLIIINIVLIHVVTHAQSLL